MQSARVSFAVLLRSLSSERLTDRLGNRVRGLKVTRQTLTYNTPYESLFNTFFFLLSVDLFGEKPIEKRETNVSLYMTLNGGSLGSWIDEERSKVR